MIKRKNVKYGWINFCYILTILALSALTILPNQSKSGFNVSSIVVQVASVLLLLSNLAIYIQFNDKELAIKLRNIITMCIVLVFCYALVYVASLWENVGLFLVPFALCSTILALVVSSGTGFYANFTVIMLYFIQEVNFTEGTDVSASVFYLLFSGIIEVVYSSFVFSRHTRRSDYILLGVIIGAISSICYVITAFMFNSHPSWQDFITRILLAFCSGPICTMLTFLLVPVLEKLLNVVSVFRFAEIANSETPLMRRLFENAPGTYNHSMTVAIYAEACATAIGISPIEARAAAYYHDIGKLKNPSYFSENQLDGINPHDSMTPEDSVQMIRTHTTYGLVLAKEYGLPKEVQSAIVEHHGTMPLKYFYLKAKKYTDGDLAYDEYSYGGPKPTNKISALLMICDACEAALRSSGDKAKASNIVNDIVRERITFDQFSDCDLSLKEIDIIKSTIITTFSGIRHQRVKYPNVKLEDK